MEIPIADAPYAIAGLPPWRTGLSFAVWVSPRAGTEPDPVIRVADPPYGAQPEAVYRIRPFGFVAGHRWLSPQQEADLAAWVTLNERPLREFWEGRIHDDAELKAKLIGIGDTPPANHREAVGALRVLVPELRSIRWHRGVYHLYLQPAGGHPAGLAARFAELGFAQTPEVCTSDAEDGILLWHRPER